MEATGLFEAVVEFEEKRDTAFPELAKYRQDTGNLVKNLVNRVRFTRKFARALAPTLPVEPAE